MYYYGGYNGNNTGSYGCNNYSGGYQYTYPSYGYSNNFGSSAAIILVLFILLVIIIGTRSFTNN